MFPVLVWMYARLAKQEEQEAVAEFGIAYARYAAQTPAFFLVWYQGPLDSNKGSLN